MNQVDREIMIQYLISQMGAILSDTHVVLASGKHSDSYMNKDAIYPHTETIASLCEMIAGEFVYSDIDAVIAPAIGGVILSQWTAYYLSRATGRDVLSVYAEKTTDGNFAIERGYDKLIAGKRVLVVEDVLTTGGSVKKVIEAARLLDCNIIGLGAICNRGKVTLADVANPPMIFSLVNLDIQTWNESDCPLCKLEVPINTTVGRGKKFLAETSQLKRKTFLDIETERANLD